ncbi:MAG: helix-turn-helix domain-containing protein [Euryarchaeota archaeon]|jgi:predicted transcriptional regulator|nr:helix-turn-helix domain-containing protein [Euryarchaeota archaeon]MBT4982596.1 helix-turn-helix domain-containing protein [Euryarchaeota archaeon]MBT5184429.1 helix-turn-helix domain-containing protein [Euryarchaeota archaeon]
MALLKQWISQRPWLAAGIVGATGGLVGLGSSLSAFAFSRGSVDAKVGEFEHPLRRRILRTLEKSPGLCYRELQSNLSAANGTLRHHLDVLTGRKSITIISVNGRTCYFAGAPTQVEVLRGMNVGESEAASKMPIGLSLVQRTIIDDIRINGIPRSQASLARRIGRSRATVHSAIKVLRRRGIMREDRIEMAPHLIDAEEWQSSRALDYEWSDERR